MPEDSVLIHPSEPAADWCCTLRALMETMKDLRRDVAGRRARVDRLEAASMPQRDPYPLGFRLDNAGNIVDERARDIARDDKPHRPSERKESAGRPFWMGGDRDWDDDWCRNCGGWVDHRLGGALCGECRAAAPDATNA